jgi:hypothetical protein
MTDLILRFLNDLDAALAPEAGERRLILYHIGRSALVWQYGFAAATADIDVIHLTTDGSPLLEKALRLYGKHSAKAAEYNLYLESIPEGLPPVPVGFFRRATEVQRPWQAIQLFHLEPNDLAATKLNRFSAKDQEDIREMCDRELLDPDLLERRLESAFLFSLAKDGDEIRDGAFAHLRVVQRYLREGVWLT